MLHHISGGLRLSALHAIAIFCSLFGSVHLSASDFCRELTLAYSDGDIGGRLQAPFEDFPDTAFSRRSFAELGYDGFHQLTANGRYQFQQHRFYINFDRTRLDTQADADLSFSTTGDFDPNTGVPSGIADGGALSGSNGGLIFTDADGVVGIAQPLQVPVKTNIDLDLYRLGYQYEFTHSVFDRRLELSPGVELAMLDFDYRLQVEAPVVTPGNPSLSPSFGVDAIFTQIPDPDFAAFAVAIPTSVDRSYTEGALRIGGTAEFWLNERLSLTAEVYDSLPVDDWAQVRSVMAGIRFSAYRWAKAELLFQLRAGQETLEYEDGLDDLRAEYRDLVEGAVSVRF